MSTAEEEKSALRQLLPEHTINLVGNERLIPMHHTVKPMIQAQSQILHTIPPIVEETIIKEKVKVLEPFGSETNHIVVPTHEVETIYTSSGSGEQGVCKKKLEKKVMRVLSELSSRVESAESSIQILIQKLDFMVQNLTDIQYKYAATQVPTKIGKTFFITTYNFSHDGHCIG